MYIDTGELGSRSSTHKPRYGPGGFRAQCVDSAIRLLPAGLEVSQHRVKIGGRLSLFRIEGVCRPVWYSKAMSICFFRDKCPLAAELYVRIEIYTRRGQRHHRTQWLKG